tara:strand:+ start:90 stop:422 length:333 start_codon:yes stop_codon:yes gene_type:complete
MANTESKIEKLQKLEQNLQNVLAQKQAFQTQTAEVENALKEVKKTNSNPFKLIGGIMVESNKESVEKDLNSKKDVSELRLKSLEKQEAKATEEIKSLQEEVVTELKNSGS